MRTNERTNAVRVPVVEGAPTYVVTIPTSRRKTRQSFDIFEDQYDALKRTRLARGRPGGEHPWPEDGGHGAGGARRLHPRESEEIGNDKHPPPA